MKEIGLGLSKLKKLINLTLILSYILNNKIRNSGNDYLGLALSNLTRLNYLKLVLLFKKNLK